MEGVLIRAAVSACLIPDSSRTSPSQGNRGIGIREQQALAGGLIEAIVHFLTTYQLFWISWASSCFSTDWKPARARYSRVFSSPHIAPRPSPPCARDTVMQCMQETV